MGVLGGEVVPEDRVLFIFILVNHIGLQSASNKHVCTK